MFENIKAFLQDKKFNYELKQELFVNYIKIRELSNLNDDKDNDNDNELHTITNATNTTSDLFLLFNRKEETDIQKECNGLILEKDTNNVVCACQNVFESEIPNNGELIDAEYCEDGTVLRLYYYNNKWTVATRKCIDAKYSYWSSQKTFNDMFWELFEHVDVSTLNRDCTYLFVLLHKENNFIVKHYENRLIYTGCINNKTCEYVVDDIHNRYKTNMKLPDKIDVSTMELDLETKYNFLKYFNPQKRGVLLKFKVDNQIKVVKIDFNEFSKLKDIRGNEPQIRMRYLQLLQEPEKLQILINYYPEHEFLFDMIYHSLNKLCNSIYSTYRDTHVKHLYKIDDSHIFFQTLRQLHAHYKITNIPITMADVMIKIKSLNPYILKKFLSWV
jgi:hypothetical protein